MAGKNHSKLKLLYLKEIFEEYTDENNVLNSIELAELLAARGVECERKSIYSDIDVLIEYGMDIIKTHTPKNGFFLASRELELSEIRLLSDAVQAASFITPKKTRDLVAKIESFTSRENRRTLKEQVYIDNRKKCSNEEIYYNIYSLDKAIKTNRRVRLNYTKRKLDRLFSTQKESREFILSPYALIWSNDHYYLVANNGKYDNLMNIRVDRIRGVEILDEKSRSFSQVSEYKAFFDAADYASKVFNMFSGTPETAELKCSPDILEEMLDRFGENTPIKPAGDGGFYLRADVCVTEGFASWVMQFGEKIEVIAPQSLRELVASKARAISAIYDM